MITLCYVSLSLAQYLRVPSLICLDTTLYICSCCCRCCCYSFSTVLQDEGLSVVIDTLGRETAGSIAYLKQALGAQYISIMPDILKLAVDEGQ
jgi:hypothetical protein